MTDRIQVRRGTTAEWAAANPILAEGEPGFDTTTGNFRVGNGVNRWSDLPSVNQTVFDSRFAPISLGEIQRQTATGTGSIATIQTIFTVTFTAADRRRYRIRTLMHFAMGGSVGTATGSITDSGGTTLESVQLSVSAGFVGFLYVENEVAPGPVSVTYLVRAVANAACTMNGSATQHHWVTVDDIGAG